MAIPILIDCDPGVDDAIMLLLALASPELDVRAITTTAGNVAAALTARNARIIRDLAERKDVPVYAGCEGPLLREPVDAGRFHGASGLGPLPAGDATPQPGPHAVDKIIELVMTAPPKALTIVVTGPMTNLAVALRREPAAAPRIGRVVAMGGARSAGGNITASAEFNIFADPHAAQIVLASDVDMVLFGLDVTHQVRAEARHIAAIERLASPRAEAAARLLRFSDGIMREIDPALGAPLHDPCTIAWLIRPELFEFRAATVEVETGSALTLGHTAVEFRRPANHLWATRADADGVFALLAERLA